MSDPRERPEPAPERGTMSDPNQANREPTRDRGARQVHEDPPTRPPNKDDAGA